VFHNKVYIALGSNLGNWKNNFNQSINLLANFGKINKIASTYFSKPFGYQNQNFFYNTVIEYYTHKDPISLLNTIRIIEKKLQKNKKIDNGPRKIDLDIIFFNHIRLNSRILDIPHKEAHKRDFVLLPIKEISPFLIHPILKKSISELYNELKKKYVFKIRPQNSKSLIFF